MKRRKVGILARYRELLLGRGQFAFTKDDALEELEIENRAFLGASNRMLKSGHLVKPKQGFYVVVPPEYAGGAPSPGAYIDSLMNFLQVPYYTGLLTAGSYHGATHHATMRFQVVVNRQLKGITVGRDPIDFFFRGDFDAVAQGVQEQQTRGGKMSMSSPELTGFDLLRYPHAVGSLDYIATVLHDLAQEIDAVKLARLSAVMARHVVQRLGFLLEELGHGHCTKLMHNMLREHGHVRWRNLDPSPTAPQADETSPGTRNRRWKIFAKRLPDPDT